MDILEEIHVVQHELGRHVILEGDDVRVVDGAVGMVFLDERSMFKDRRGQRGSKGDRDEMAMRVMAVRSSQLTLSSYPSY